MRCGAQEAMEALLLKGAKTDTLNKVVYVKINRKFETSGPCMGIQGCSTGPY